VNPIKLHVNTCKHKKKDLRTATFEAK